MPNAKDLDITIQNCIYLVGAVGVGKTTQILTFPGKKFIYMFDSNGLNALSGFDIDYEAFPVGKLNFTVSALKKGGGSTDPHITGASRTSAIAFARWEKHFNESIDSGFFEQHNVIAFDSTTSFAYAMMYDILARDGRQGQVPQQGDYNVVGEQLRRVFTVFNQLASYGKIVLVMGHTLIEQTGDNGPTLNNILIPGKQKLYIPAEFGSVLLCDYKIEQDKKGHQVKRFYVQSHRDNLNQNLKSDIRNFPLKLDVTIEDFSRPTEYGIGKFLRDGLQIGAVSHETGAHKVLGAKNGA